MESDKRVEPKPVTDQSHLKGLPFIPAPEKLTPNVPVPLFFNPPEKKRQPGLGKLKGTYEDPYSDPALPALPETDQSERQKDEVQIMYVELEDPIMRAIIKGDVKKINQLIQKGNPVHWNEGWTPLCLAAERGNEKVFDLILSKVPSEAINYQISACGETALHKAIIRGHTYVVKRLIEKGADVNIMSKSGHPLEYAIGYDQEEIAMMLLDTGKVAVNSSMEGKGLLNAATEYGVPKVFYRLLELGASVNAPEGYFSPLHSAAKFGRLEMCRELLNRGARVNALDSNNCNPLMLACRYGHHRAYDPEYRVHLPKELLDNRLQVVSLLIDAGSGVNLRSKDGWSVMELAIRYGPVGVVEMIHTAGSCDLNEKNTRDSGTPVSIAVQCAPLEALIYVLHNGGDPNTVVGENDETVLMLAARMRPPPFVRILLAHGADYTRTDKNGMTALMHALTSECIAMETIELLTKDKLVDLDQKDAKGRTLMEYAKKSKNKHVCKYFKALAKANRK